MSLALNFSELLRKEKLKKKQELQRAEEGKRTIVQQRLPLDLEKHRIASNVPIFYFPNFLSKLEQSELQSCALNDTEYQWKNLGKRKLKYFGGIPVLNQPIREVKLPIFLQQVSRALSQTELFTEEEPSNHCLLNSYTNGQGIDFHKDGPLFLPRVAILSFGTSCTIEFHSCKPSKLSEPTVPTCPTLLHSIDLEPGSLLFFEGDAYTQWYHGIKSKPLTKPQLEDRIRYSFTMRRVYVKIESESELNNNFETEEGYRERKRNERQYEMSLSDL